MSEIKLKINNINALELIAKNSFIVVNKKLAHLLTLEGATLLAHFASAENYHKKENDWFFQTYDHIETSTTLSKHRAHKAIKYLKRLQILDVKLMGLPRLQYFRINKEALSIALLVENPTEHMIDLYPVLCKSLTTISQKSSLMEVKDFNCNNNTLNNNKGITKVIHSSQKSEQPIITINSVKDKTPYKKELSNNQQVGNIFETNPATDWASPEIKQLIQDMIVWGGFGKVKLPKPGTLPSNVLRDIVKHIKQIKSGTFCKCNKLDPNWVKKQNIKNIDGTVLDSKELKRVLRTACKNVNLSRQEGYFPKNKNSIPKYLKNFFYNDQNKNSQFLRLLNNKPETDEKMIAVFQANQFEKKLKVNLEKTYNTYRQSHWGEKQEMYFLGSCVKLKTFYTKNYKALMEYNKQVNNNSFGFKCGSLESFFNYVDKFYKFAGMYKTTFIDPNDKEGAGYWSGFVNWMLMENNIQLLVTAKNLEQARKLKKKETEMESQKELDVELRKNGGDIKKAKEEIVRKKAINKRAKYYLPIIKKEFEKKGKTVKQSILKSMAEDRAEEELDNV